MSETKISKLTFWNIWISYAIYYFGKVNLSIVIPALLATIGGLSMYNVGLVASGFLLTYALGQFLHGQISERFNPFVYISIGLIASGIVNLCLGFWGGFFLILLIGEMCDGFFQSMGWSSCVRANALLQPADQKEKSSILLGTSYQVGNSVAWLICAFSVGLWGWAAGFFVASFFLIARGISLLITKPDMPKIPCQKIKTQILKTLNPSIIMGGLALCLLNMIRYGLIIWIPLYLFTLSNLAIASMGIIGLKICLLPIAGVLGTLLFHKLKINKDILATIFLIGLGISFFILPFTAGWVSVAVLALGSFLLYGPHVFLVSTLPSRFADEKLVAAATGFIDGMGYVGSVSVGIVVPFLVALAAGAWFNVFIFWGVLSMLTSILTYISYRKFFKKES